MQLLSFKGLDNCKDAQVSEVGIELGTDDGASSNATTWMPLSMILSGGEDMLFIFIYFFGNICHQKIPESYRCGFPKEL